MTQTPATRAYDERALVQGTAWVLVLLALGMDVFHRSWKSLAVVAGLVLLISMAIAIRHENVNLVAFLKKTGIWSALMITVLVVELGVHAHWDIDSVTSGQVTTATVLVMIGDLVAEARDHVSEKVGSHQQNDRIRDSVNTIGLTIEKLRLLTAGRRGR
ncbi:hypothetical protein ACWD4B_18470 [Streptomyces sp. NPDC002536]